jgi:ACS family D-galactonate transporter-like MFS transporter
MAEATEGRAGLQRPSGARKVMWFAMMIPFFADFYVRQALPQLIGFIAAERAATAGQKALLLGSFFPGYVSAQIPSGVLASILGPKPIITANLLGNAALMALLPLAAAGDGVAWLAACLCGVGLFQAPMVPAISALYGTWMPKSERAFALALPELGSKIAMVFSPLTVPLGYGRIVASEIKAPIMLANLV